MATLAGQWLWILGVVLICAALLCSRRLPQLTALGVVALTAVVAGIALMDSRNFQLLTKRQPQPVCREDSGVTVCMWPARSQDIDRWLSAAQRYRSTFAELGSRPSRFVEHGLDWSSPSGGKLGSIDEGTPDFELVESLALPRVYGRPPECAKSGPDSYGCYTGIEAREVLAGWFKREIRPEQPPEALVSPTRVGDMRILLAAPEAEQVAWVHEAMAAKNDCVTPMPELS